MGFFSRNLLFTLINLVEKSTEEFCPMLLEFLARFLLFVYFTNRLKKKKKNQHCPNSFKSKLRYKYLKSN